VNDFVDRGRVKRVFIQGDAPSRMLPQDLTSWYVRNFATANGAVHGFLGRCLGLRFTEARAVQRHTVGGNTRGSGRRVSTGTALDAIQSHAKELPPGFDIQWTGLSFEERLSGSQAPALYAISLIVVFLCLRRSTKAGRFRWP